MSSFCLYISNKCFTIEDILLWNGKHSDPYTSAALTYCQNWLEGKQQFELKTSGSTGAPKTIHIHRSQIEASAISTLHFFNLKQGNAVLCPLSIHVIGGQMMLYRSIIGGLNLYLIPPSKNLEALDTSIDYAFMPIAALQLFEVLNNGPEKIQALNKLNHLLIGGSTLTDTLLNKIRSTLTCQIWQSYGMTETVSHIAMRSIYPVTAESYTLLEHIEAKVDNRSCLRIKGAVTNNEWIQTNDCVELKGRTHFNFLGRADFTINSGGIKIQVEPIEKIINTLFIELNINTDFFLGGIPDEALGEKLVLVMNGAFISDDTRNTLKEKLKELLPKYHVPKEIVSIPFKYTASGKINRKETLKK